MVPVARAEGLHQPDVALRRVSRPYVRAGEHGVSASRLCDGVDQAIRAGRCRPALCCHCDTGG